jgi:hypothetical protein
MDDLAGRLKLSYATASNDDYSKPMTRERERHVARLEAISDAITELAALRTECDALRKDAERYRWLREHQRDGWLSLSYDPDWHLPAGAAAQRAYLDAAIDAALQGQSNA